VPAIRTHARISFRHLDPEAREEAVQESICNACVAYKRLVDLKKTDLAYPNVLARFAISQVKGGRKVGGHMNCLDVASQYCQMRKGVTVERLDRYDAEEDAWREILIEDRHATPADVARVRLDFAAWLRTLSRRTRKITEVLATGENTTAVAKRFHVSAGRISQMRRQLMDAWQVFQGEPAMA
jgi:hypothetical protein